PALHGCGLAFSLVGRRPASGRGLDVYADQTLADALRGVAGSVAYAPGVTLNGSDEPPTRAGSPVPGGTPPARSYGSPRCRHTGTRSTLAERATSTPLPPLPFLPWPVRRCWPPSTRAGPTPRGCTGRAGARGCCWTPRARRRRRPSAAARTN